MGNGVVYCGSGGEGRGREGRVGRDAKQLTGKQNSYISNTSYPQLQQNCYLLVQPIQLPSKLKSLQQRRHLQSSTPNCIQLFSFQQQHNLCTVQIKLVCTVQRIYELEKGMGLVDCMDVVVGVMKGLDQIRRCYGMKGFKICMGMVGRDGCGRVKIWVNQNFAEVDPVPMNSIFPNTQSITIDQIFSLSQSLYQNPSFPDHIHHLKATLKQHFSRASPHQTTLDSAADYIIQYLNSYRYQRGHGGGGRKEETGESTIEENVEVEQSFRLSSSSSKKQEPQQPARTRILIPISNYRPITPVYQPITISNTTTTPYHLHHHLPTTTTIPPITTTTYLSTSSHTSSNRTSSISSCHNLQQMPPQQHSTDRTFRTDRLLKASEYPLTPINMKQDGQSLFSSDESYQEEEEVKEGMRFTFADYKMEPLSPLNKAQNQWLEHDHVTDKLFPQLSKHLNTFSLHPTTPPPISQQSQMLSRVQQANSSQQQSLYHLPLSSPPSTTSLPPTINDP